MPPFQDKEYLKRIHGALMSAYGPEGGYSKGNFDLSMDAFAQKMQDKNYASKIHGALEGAYGNNGGYSKGNFSLSFDDFYKKAAGGQQQAAPQAQQQPQQATQQKAPQYEPPEITKIKSEVDKFQRGAQDNFNKSAKEIADSFKPYIEIAAASGDKAEIARLEKMYAEEIKKKEREAETAMEREVNAANKKIESLYSSGAMDIEAKKSNLIASGTAQVNEAKRRLIESGITEEEIESVTDEESAKKLASKAGFALTSSLKSDLEALARMPASADNTRGPRINLPAGVQAQPSREEVAKRRLADLMTVFKGRLNDIAMVSAHKIAQKNITASPRDIGAEALRISDPEKYELWRKTGFTEPETARAVEEIGITALASVGDRNVANLLVGDLETIDDRFPQKDIAITRQLLAAERYKRTGVFGKMFGTPHTVSGMEESAKELPEKYKKIYEKYIKPEEERLGMSGSMLPNWGLSLMAERYIDNAVTMAEGAGSVLGLRNVADSELAYSALSSMDNASSELLGENSYLSQRKKQLSGMLFRNEKLTAGELQELDALKSAEKARGRAQKFLDGSASVAGDVLAFATVARALGMPMAALGVSKGTADVIGLLASGYLASEGDSAESALEAFPYDNQKVDRFFYKQIMQWSTAASELIFRDTKLLDLVKKGIAPKAAAIARQLASNKISAASAKASIADMVGELIKVGKYGLSNADQEAREEVAPILAETIYLSLVAPNKVDIGEKMNEAWDTYATMLIDGAIVGAIGGYKDYKQNKVSAPFVASVGRAGFEKYTSSIEKAILELERSGEITAEQAAEKRQIIEDITKANKDLDLAMKTGSLTLTDRVRNKAVLLTANIDQMKRKAMEIEDPIVRAPIIREIQRLNDMRADLIDGKLFVSEDGAIKTPEVAAKEMLQEEKADTLKLEAEKAVVNQEEVKADESELSVNEIIDEPVVYNGSRGRVYADGQQLVFKKEGEDVEYELGNVNEVGKKPISELGISTEKSVVGFDDTGNVTVRGESFVNNFSDPLMAINRNENGDIVSVNLETKDGKKRTFRGAIAEDVAYNIQLKKITENNAERKAFEDFINEDEEARSAIDSGAVPAVAEEPAVVADEQVQQPEGQEVVVSEKEEEQKMQEEVKTATKPELQLQDLEDSDFDKLSSFEMEKQGKVRDRAMRDFERLNKLVECIWT